VRVGQTVDDATIKIGGLPGLVGGGGGKGANCVYASSASAAMFKNTKYACAPSITLRGYSTSRWIVTAVNPETTSAGTAMIFATST